jgi:predicted nucleic acid-binding protein
MSTRVLIDNAALDSILYWPRPASEQLRQCLSSRRLTVYFAPETIVEALAIGATSRASRIPELASLILSLLNGRILEYYFDRILDEVRGRVTSPFLNAEKVRQVVGNLKFLAAGNSPNDPGWFAQGAEMIRQDKERDNVWRTQFQAAYRSHPKSGGFRRHDLEQFCAAPNIKLLALSRIEAFCTKGGVIDPQRRASELMDSGMNGAPVLRAHVELRIARLWWYTEAAFEGRKVGLDHFDDALLTYMPDLQCLVTPDRALLEFARVHFPEKEMLDPDEFQKQLLSERSSH